MITSNFNDFLKELKFFVNQLLRTEKSAKFNIVAFIMHKEKWLLCEQMSSSLFLLSYRYQYPSELDMLVLK